MTEQRPIDDDKTAQEIEVIDEGRPDDDGPPDDCCKGSVASLR